MYTDDKLPPTHDLERSIREQEALKSKERIVEVTEALSEGKLPTTSQINTAIDEIHQSEILHNTARGMSVLGKKVFADLEKLLESVEIFLEEKNAGDEIQNVIYYGTQAAKDISAKNLSSSERIGQEISDIATTSKPLIEEGIRKASNISRLLISSSEFRKLVNDIGKIAQDIIITATDESETNDQKRKEIGADIANRNDEEKAINETIGEIGQKVREQVYPTVKTTAKMTEPYIKEVSEGKSSVQDSTKEGIKAMTSNIKTFISSYQISPKVREQLMERFKNVMIVLQKNPEYQQAINDLINIVSQITEKSSEFVTNTVQPIITAVSTSSDDETHYESTDLQRHQHQPSRSTSSTLTAAADIEIAEHNAKELLERFANDRSLDPLISAVNEFGQKIESDNDLYELLKDLKQFILSSLLDSNFVKKTNYIQQGSEMIVRGQKILLNNYGELTQRIVNEVQEFNKAIMEDKTTLELKKDIDILIKDLFLDELGHFAFKFQLIKDFSIILPCLAKKLEYIPLPRYEYSDENIDFIVDNIVVHLHETFPKHINIGLNADIDMDRSEENRMVNIVTIEISKIHVDARNIAFYYKKKRGFFKFTDIGWLDFSIPQDGGIQLYIKAKVIIPTDGSKSISIQIERNYSHINELRLRFHQTRYSLLYKLFLPVIERNLKEHLENAINQVTHRFGKNFENQLILVQRQMQKYYYYDDNTHVNDGQSKDKLKHKMSWESPAFDPTIGATSSSNAITNVKEKTVVHE